ncbi:MAG: zinc-dependent metalloprotease, partial [Pseudomonadota bacterium]
RSITLTVQHSILAMPEPGFQPRFDDYRVGYFFDQVTDLTSFEAAPYRDLINRWRLEKADPEAELSEPVKPITYWIENTTPYEFRDAIKEGVLAWNEAFEAAGFKNALRVEVQPDDAEWDAGDIRYNVLRWTSSPSPPFGGYGPSFTNPRTGEILGADIMLELSYLKTFALRSEAFDTAGLPASAAEPLGHDEDDHQHHDHQNGKNDRRFHCAAGEEMRNKLGFSIAALAAAGADAEEQAEMVRQALVSLIMHEVGHTLGLQHNMKASSAFGHREIHDPEVTKGAPSSSVMDYHAVNIAPLGVPQGDYDHTRPGTYDIWAVVFGYSPDTDDTDFRAQLLAKSSDPHLAFGNDADAMASPYNGIDPRTMIFDQSSDPVAYAIDRIELIQSIFPRLLERYNGEGSYQKLLRQYFVLSGQMARMGAVISKQIGGVYVERSDPGNGDIAPYTPVPAAQQREAMQALADYIFAPDAFSISPDLMRRLQRQRRGFNFYFNTEDPKIHGRVAATQSMVLRQLMNPRTMQRLTDSALYGNRYSAAQMIQDLNDAVFGRDLAGRPNTFRRNLQIDYTERLVRMATSPAYDPVANAAAFAGLQDLKSRFGFVPEFLLSLETRAHRAAIRHELK